MQETKIEEAFKIATRDLRECYDENGIVAGRDHLQNYWARDGFFATLGANKLRDFEIVKKNLDLFLSFQREDGLIPMFISRKKLKPKYGLLSNAVDSNSLLIIAFADYVRHSRDKLFLEKNYKKISLAMDWLNKKDKDGLIEEGFFANWQGTIIKSGEVLYSNCCYYYALKEFAWLSKRAGVTMLEAEYEKRAEKTKHVLNLKFWQGDYYYDWIDFSIKNYFDSAGNLLAIFWDIASEYRANEIIRFIEENELNKIPLKTTEPEYGFWRVIPFLLPFKAYYYHNGFSWPWLGCIYALALNKIGQKEKALEELKKVAELIDQECVCHEVFDFEGKPVSSLLLKSERPFAWTAGLFVRACSEILEMEKKKSKRGNSFL